LVVPQKTENADERGFEMNGICASLREWTVAPRVEGRHWSSRTTSDWTPAILGLLVSVVLLVGLRGWVAVWSATIVASGAIVAAILNRAIRSKFSELRADQERLKAALDESTRRAHESVQLNELVDLLQSCQTAEEAYNVVAAALPRILSSPSGALYLTGSSQATLEIVKTWGSYAIGADSFDVDECWALRRGQIHRVTHADSPARCKHSTELPAAGSLCVPLVAQGRTVGGLCVEYPESARHQPDGARLAQLDAIDRLAHITGQRLSSALANLALREELRHQSVRDPLTGLFNRRYLEETLQRELRRSERNGDVVALLMLDIDHFKRLNDSFGHQAGDALLKKFGEFLCRRTRGQDVACRYGGEEFVVILSGASLETAKERAELLREEARNVSVQFDGRVLRGVTVSVGVSASPAHGSTAEDLLRAADAALYRAKTRGRNLVVVGHAAPPEFWPGRAQKPMLRSVTPANQPGSPAAAVQLAPRTARVTRLKDPRKPDQNIEQPPYEHGDVVPGASVA
jgi:diguanylate cyclase (GGDEF)-like protein